MTFGERLRLLRENRQLSQLELSKLLNISNSTLSLYESNKRFPEPEILKKIAEFFEVSIDYLLGRTDIPNAYIPEEYKQKYKVTKRDIKQYEQAMQQLQTFFFDDKVSEEDKEKIFRDISEIFWEAKEKNKQKYGRKKKNKG